MNNTLCCLFLLFHVTFINGVHFNGGTIRWTPADPYDNSSSIKINLIQSYWWTYPRVQCATNVPISTALYSSANANLICIADCSTDGGYSSNPIDILTDCSVASSPVGLMISQRSVSVTLSAGAHFYVAYRGIAWRPLNISGASSPNWSIVSFIDLRLRPDGFINTPPVARVVSPQYVIVNETVHLPISVEDVNTGDDIRCRWATSSGVTPVDECGGICYPAGILPTASLSNCTLTFQGLVAGSWYAAAVQVGFFYENVIRLFISFLPFQVEDFIDTTSTIPMSSVPVQFLIYIIPKPVCSIAPVFIPIAGCLEATVGVTKSVDIYVMDLCTSTTIDIADIFITYSSAGMQLGTLNQSSANASLFYKTLTWTPQANQVGRQELCLVAFTE